MRISLILITLLLASFGGSLLKPYKMDIRQGNYLTTEMREKLRLGMSKQQVRYVLGSPTVADPFHAPRWDYVYRLEHEGAIAETQQLTLYFDGDNLVRVEEGGKRLDNIPAMEREAEPVQPAAAEAAATN